ncbi:UNVERIFIED_CONTAM: hypothetical protein PYX00_009810 [Menopon gallinae]|uniref:Splicing factor U2af 38 kDa subunit n=1 Tax=Menopon gallinae TaxID=328185 RepID=A0AAW2HCZ2_9NEOP
MAEYLASIFGTEKDKVNCSFYFKIGACRHGDRCSRIHNKPSFSQTTLLQNLYVNPQNSAKSADGSHLVANVSDEEMQEHYDNFFEDVFVECEDKYGEIEEMNVCDNLGDHLVGNVYIKFRREEDAEKAVNDLNNRWFGGRPVYAELSPVTDFREACCRQYEMGECTRSGFCNFMHLKPISRELRRYLYSRRRKGDRKRFPGRGAGVPSIAPGSDDPEARNETPGGARGPSPAPETAPGRTRTTGETRTGRVAPAVTEDQRKRHIFLTYPKYVYCFTSSFE